MALTSEIITLLDGVSANTTGTAQRLSGGRFIAAFWAEDFGDGIVKIEIQLPNLQWLLLCEVDGGPLSSDSNDTEPCDIPYNANIRATLTGAIDADNVHCYLMGTPRSF